MESENTYNIRRNNDAVVVVETVETTRMQEMNRPPELERQGRSNGASEKAHEGEREVNNKTTKGLGRDGEGGDYTEGTGMMTSSKVPLLVGFPGTTGGFTGFDLAVNSLACKSLKKTAFDNSISLLSSGISKLGYKTPQRCAH